MHKKDTAVDHKSTLIKTWLGSYPGRTIHRLGALLGGIWIAGSTITIFWPIPDEIAPIKSLREISLKTAPNISIPLTMIFSTIEDKGFNKVIESKTNSNAVDLKSITLIKFDPNKPIKLINIPIDIGLILPSSDEIMSLNQIYRSGGIHLISDVVNEIADSDLDEIKRYLTIKSSTLVNGIDRLGGLNILNPKVNYTNKNYESKIKKEKIERIQISGAKARDLFIDKENSYSTNNEIQEEIREELIKAFFSSLADSNNHSEVQIIAKEIISNSETNLTLSELIRLTAAYILKGKSLDIETIKI